jgi:hypothetical protein
MTTSHITEEILRRRMHGLYLSRPCGDITTLSHELLGLHSWFARNVPFSALIRGADIAGWKTTLTKTWLYRGTLHGVVFEDLPTLLALYTGGGYLEQLFGRQVLDDFAEVVLRLMEDGVFSRTEFRRIFIHDYDAAFIEAMFSSWGGIFVHLARRGQVAFRSMDSRDFDLISAEPTQTVEEVLPELLRRYFSAYGPATVADAAGFLGLGKEEIGKLRRLPLDEFRCLELGGNRYYSVDDADMADIPRLTLLSGFDPYIVSYSERSMVLSAEYKSRVILKSGICLPTIALDGRVAGIWNIKKNQPLVEFFTPQPKSIVTAAGEMVDFIRQRVR